MPDISDTIKPKSDQLNADDLLAGSRTIKVREVRKTGSGDEQPVSVYFDGDDGKPFKPCKSMRRVLVTVWDKETDNWVGKSMTIYNDPGVMWGGQKVGGIRISHMTDLQEPFSMALTVTKSVRKPYTVNPLVIEQTPDKTAAHQLEAREAAKDGTPVFTAWWSNKSDPELAAKRAAAKGILAELKTLAAEADAAIDGADDTNPINTPEPLAAELAERLKACIDTGMIDDLVVELNARIDGETDTVQAELDKMVAARRKEIE